MLYGPNPGIYNERHTVQLVNESHMINPFLIPEPGTDKLPPNGKDHFADPPTQ